MNGDYRPDFAVVNSESDDIYLYKNIIEPNWRFSPPQTFGVGDCPNTVIAADMDDDGREDLIITNRNDSSVSVLFSCGIAFGIGDMNADGIYDIIDVVLLVGHVFRNEPPPFPDFRADVTCNSIIDIFDVVELVNHVFRNGPQPHCP
jgi:hypothetical protein